MYFADTQVEWAAGIDRDSMLGVFRRLESSNIRAVINSQHYWVFGDGSPAIYNPMANPPDEVSLLRVMPYDFLRYTFVLNAGKLLGRVTIRIRNTSMFRIDVLGDVKYRDELPIYMVESVEKFDIGSLVKRARRRHRGGGSYEN